MVFYFAWVDPTETTYTTGMHREDENVFAFRILQGEGDFAELKVNILNPHVGLLASGRKLWAWFAWNDGTTTYPLFFGELVSLPTDIQNEIVELTFLAKPIDYDVKKLQLADTLRVLPYYDPVFISGEAAVNPDTVLEARASLWHIDRLTHTLTISDISNGEDGTINFAGNYFYDSLRVSFNPQQVRRVDMTMTVSWRQQAYGIIDISDQFPNPIKTLTGAGLFKSWPQAGTAIGPNWKVFYSEPLITDFSVTSRFSNNQQLGSLGYGVSFGTGLSSSPMYATQQLFLATHDGSEAQLDVWTMQAAMQVEYDVNRQFTEILRFSMIADVQLLQPYNNPPAPVNLTIPAITGLAQENKFLSASTGTWTNNPTVYNYQWKRSGVIIPGAQANFYLCTGDDIGYPLSCQVTASNLGGNANATSTATANTLPAIGYFQVNAAHRSGAYFNASATLGAVAPSYLNPMLLIPKTAPLYTKLPPTYSGGSVTWQPATDYVTGDVVSTPWQDIPAPYGTIPQVATSFAHASKDIEQISISGVADTFVDPPAVAGGMPTLPIGTINARRYFATPRGLYSFEHGMLQARARLIAAARACDISFQVPFAAGIAATLRKNASVVDPRLPGGGATGKIKGYTFELDGSTGAATATITIGCMVGNGNAPSAGTGTNSYAGAGYAAPGWQDVPGAQYITGTDIVWTDYSSQQPWDDGIDFANITSAQAVKSARVYLDAEQQGPILFSDFSTLGAISNNPDTPSYIRQQDAAKLEADVGGLYTTIELQLHDFFPGPITTPINVGAVYLAVSKTIDLGA